MQPKARMERGMSESLERAGAMEQLIYEIACDELPYMQYRPREVLQVQDRRRRRMEEMKDLLMGEEK